MFVTPAQAGGERKRRAFALSFSVGRNAKKLLGRSRARIAATDGQAQQRRTSRPCRHPRTDNGEPAFAGWQNPRGTRSAASSPRYLRDDV